MTVKTVQDEARERVANGVELLDDWNPEWIDAVDLDRLDMRDPYACVASQVTDQGYPSAVRTLGLREGDGDEWGDGGKPYGFHAWTELPWGSDDESHRAIRASEWAELEAEWRRVIAERRAA